MARSLSSSWRRAARMADSGELAFSCSGARLNPRLETLELLQAPGLRMVEVLLRSAGPPTNCASGSSITARCRRLSPSGPRPEEFLRPAPRRSRWPSIWRFSPTISVR